MFILHKIYNFGLFKRKTLTFYQDWVFYGKTGYFPWFCLFKNPFTKKKNFKRWWETYFFCKGLMMFHLSFHAKKIKIQQKLCKLLLNIEGEKYFILTWCHYDINDVVRITFSKRIFLFIITITFIHQVFENLFNRVSYLGS